MGLMNGRDYRESLRDGRRVWIDGERVPDVTRHPAFRPMIGAVERIYEMQHEDRFRALLTFDGRSRFYKPPASHEDLVMRRHMTLAILDEVSPVMDRFGDETVTALFVMADRKAVLERYDRRYGAAVDYWLDRLQRSNEFMTSGNTDLKGDRSKQPYQQPDPDSYLRVVAERDDGIVIRGAKYETGASYAHVAFVKPTVGQWLPENRDYAVGCVVSLSDPRVRHICRPPLAGEPDVFDLPLAARWDEIDTLLVFDDVLVPWENVFFSRQPELANVLRADLTWWAAQGFLLRSLMKADLMVGAALLVAEQTRSIVIPEVKQHIAKLMGFRETLNAFILASEAAAEETETGLWKPNQSIQNAGRVYASTTYNAMVQVLRDLAGGSPIIVPGRRSMDNPEIRADIEKYFRVGDVSAESRIRVLNLVRELTATGYAGRTQAYQMFAETPAFAQAMSLYATFDRDAAVRRAARLAGL